MPRRPGTAGPARSSSIAPQHKETEMPKLKTKSSAKKRFSRTGTGKVKRNFAFKRHCLEEKPNKMKRKARGTTIMAPEDAKIVRQYMPYL
jgi:large subunit ribosomal protein L35